MTVLLVIFYVLVCIFLILVVLLQQGKGADMGASFGAGASQTLFGSDGSGNVLTKATAWLVALFFATSFGLAILATQKSASVTELDLAIPAAVETPVEEAVVEEELPVLEDEIPAAEPAGEDVPQLD